MPSEWNSYRPPLTVGQALQQMRLMSDEWVLVGEVEALVEVEAVLQLVE